MQHLPEENPEDVGDAESQADEQREAQRVLSFVDLGILKWESCVG